MNPPDQQPSIPPELAAFVERINAWAAQLDHVRPGFVTFRVEVVDAVHEGRVEKAVQLWTSTANGVHVVTVPPALADELAGLLSDNARRARTGLEIPGGM